MTTTRRPPRTALDRARDDLTAATRRRDKAKVRLDKANAERDTAVVERGEAQTLVDYYAGAVEKLGGAGSDAVQLP